jgi:HTH-type transcriptional regulator / antitoxin HigA
MSINAQPFPHVPDYAERPGCLVEEYLTDMNISGRELARRCGRSAKLITEIVLGKATIEPETALQLERVLRVDASVWIAMESQHRLHLARAKERLSFASHVNWASKFPAKALSKRGHLESGKKGEDLVESLLQFFAIGSIDAYHSRVEDLLTADLYTSPTYGNEVDSLASWLRVGEIRAEEINPDEFDRETFRTTLFEIRKLTREPFEDALGTLEMLCAKAGVAFVLEPAIGKIATSGASRWLSPRRALIQQSGRYRSDDRFWFTFFHECAHLLLHSRKHVYIDVFKGQGSATVAQENEANDWAADFLIPGAALRKFIRSFDGTEDQILEFADEMQIAPGIVVGQLQHRSIIEFKEMNHLRQRWTWADDTA